jgi:Protein of unknown function (DUF1194)
VTVSRVSGALFKNDKKEKPSHPDYRGDAMIKGRKFWVSAWIKTPEKSGGLTAYYENNVIGGRGAFAVEAESFEAFGQLSIGKLIKEIAEMQNRRS